MRGARSATSAAMLRACWRTRMSPRRAPFVLAEQHGRHRQSRAETAGDYVSRKREGTVGRGVLCGYGASPWRAYPDSRSAGVSHGLAKDSDWGEARRAWNLAADQRPFAVAFVEGAGDVRRWSVSARQRVEGGGARHRTRRGGARLAGRRDPDQDRAHARHRDRGREGSGRGGCVGRTRWGGGGQERAVLPAGHLAERWRGRLHARRWAQLVGPKVRVCLQQSDRNRAGDRGR